MVNSLYPQAFGPGSWYGMSEELIRLYSFVPRTEDEQRFEQEETSPPLETLELVEA